MSEPYFERDGIRLWHGDCLEAFPIWGAADVLITDPPYGTQFSDDNPRGGYGRRQDAAGRGSKHAPATPGMGAWIANDDTTETRDTVLSLWERRPALVFGSPRLPEPPGAWDDRLVWDKKRPGMNGGPWRYRHESIFVRGEWQRLSDASVSILAFFPDQTVHIHAKPIALMRKLVAAAPPGLIVDPFAGSGTTLVAAALERRAAIGFELEERYCEAAAERITDALDQGSLFDLPGVA